MRGFNFGAIDRNISRDRARAKTEEDNKILEQVYKKAESLIASEQIDPRDFVDVYGEKVVQNDLAYVEHREAGYRREDDPDKAKAKMMATVFEGLVFEEAEMANWLPGCFTIKTSKFDDYKHGHDSILVIPEGLTTNSYLALGVDVTFWTNASAKFDRIVDEIKHGELAKVKYFKSDQIEAKKLDGIARVVIGADYDTIQELSDLWLNGKQKELSQHWIQFQILDEIQKQLEGFKQLALSLNRGEIAAEYDRNLKRIEEILTEKRESVPDSGRRDRIFDLIKIQLKKALAEGRQEAIA